MNKISVIGCKAHKKLEKFLDHVKTVDQNTQFIIQTEPDSYLPFLELTHYKPSRWNTLKRQLLTTKYNYSHKLD